MRHIFHIIQEFQLKFANEKECELIPDNIYICTVNTLIKKGIYYFKFLATAL